MMPDDSFYALRAMSPRSREVAELSEAIVKALGFSGTGESPASSA
jgi:hypothetical protein